MRCFSNHGIEKHIGIAVNNKLCLLLDYTQIFSDLISFQAIIDNYDMLNLYSLLRVGVNFYLSLGHGQYIGKNAIKKQFVFAVI